jgi:hypothetical protein
VLRALRNVVLVVVLALVLVVRVLVRVGVGVDVGGASCLFWWADQTAS